MAICVRHHVSVDVPPRMVIQFPYPFPGAFFVILLKAVIVHSLILLRSLDILSSTVKPIPSI